MLSKQQIFGTKGRMIVKVGFIGYSLMDRDATISNADPLYYRPISLAIGAATTFSRLAIFTSEPIIRNQIAKQRKCTSKDAES
jgi:urease alpha subunit